MSAIAQAESTDKPRLIKRSQRFEIPIPGPEGDKLCTVRYPTDEEWCARTRRVTVVRRNLGRDATQSEPQHETEAAKELLDKIMVEGDSNEFDEYEALTVITILERVTVLPQEIEKRGNVWVIPMLALGTRVVHRLKTPSQRQIHEHEKSALHMTGRRHGQDFKTALEPFGVLWDRVQDGFEGYENIDAVSIVHKHAAIQEVLARVSETIESGINPER